MYCSSLTVITIFASNLTIIFHIRHFITFPMGRRLLVSNLPEDCSDKVLLAVWNIAQVGAVRVVKRDAYV